MTLVILCLYMLSENEPLIFFLEGHTRAHSHSVIPGNKSKNKKTTKYHNQDTHGVKH